MYRFIKNAKVINKKYFLVLFQFMEVYDTIYLVEVVGHMGIASSSEAINITVNSSGGVFWTVLSGALVFILGQLFIELILQPMKRFKEIKAKISYSLIYYANVYSNPITDAVYSENSQRRIGCDEAQKSLRGLAAELAGFCEEKWFFNYPNQKIIDEVVSCLIGISNSIVTPHSEITIEHTEKRVEIIRRLLKIRL